MMQPVSQPEWKGLLAEASLALAHMDAERLEEMALSCSALVRDVDGQLRTMGRCDSGHVGAMQEMAIFARVLEATKGNLKVMHRLCEVRATHLEYGAAQTVPGALEENDYGDH
jgi:hypothetical protein